MFDLRQTQQALSKISAPKRANSFWVIILVFAVITIISQTFIGVYVYHVVREGMKEQSSVQELKVDTELGVIYRPKDVEKVVTLITERQKAFDEMIGSVPEKVLEVAPEDATEVATPVINLSPVEQKKQVVPAPKDSSIKAPVSAPGTKR